MKAKRYDPVDKIIDYESGTLSDGEVLRLFSHLVKTGLAWQLQGHYGRTAHALIEAGALDRRGNITERGKEWQSV